MVTARYCPRLPGWRALLAAVLLVPGGWLPLTAYAAVVASVDRVDVELNESFTLKVTVDTDIDREPDAAALHEDFQVLSRSDLSNTMIVNGQISRSRTWTYMLMAKRPGELVIPPVSVGSEQSNPLRITVAPQSVVLPGESDIFVSAEVDYPESYVQAQILYRVKVYRSVATRQPRLYEPDFGGVDVLVEVVGDEKNYDSVINGKNYNVAERVYALFPQASGEIAISPARFEARVLRDGRITGRKVFQSEPINVAVRPIPPPPDSHPDAVWFPAKAVELSEEWSRDPDNLPAGEPVTRHVTVTALGQLSTQIPVMEAVKSPGIRVYPDKPELRVAALPEGVVASRKDQYALIGTDEGNVRLPELSLPWWSVDRAEWQFATLPARNMRILPSGDALPSTTDFAQPAPPVEATGTVVVHSSFWRRVSGVLAATWALTLLFWWLTRQPRPPRRASEAELPPVYRQQARLLKDARRAARDGDMAAVKAALIAWARLQWPDSAPRSIGDIVPRVADPLASELAQLARVSYGPGDVRWDGRSLDRALRSLSLVTPREDADDAKGLPPLMPPVASRG